jgi:hypothetical protein
MSARYYCLLGILLEDVWKVQRFLDCIVVCVVVVGQLVRAPPRKNPDASLLMTVQILMPAPSDRGYR